MANISFRQCGKIARAKAMERIMAIDKEHMGFVACTCYRIAMFEGKRIHPKCPIHGIKIQLIIGGM